MGLLVPALLLLVGRGVACVLLALPAAAAALYFRKSIYAAVQLRYWKGKPKPTLQEEMLNALHSLQSSLLSWSKKRRFQSPGMTENVAAQQKATISSLVKSARGSSIDSAVTLDAAKEVAVNAATAAQRAAEAAVKSATKAEAIQAAVESVLDQEDDTELDQGDELDTEARRTLQEDIETAVKIAKENAEKAKEEEAKAKKQHFYVVSRAMTAHDAKLPCDEAEASADLAEKAEAAAAVAASKVETLAQDILQLPALPPPPGLYGEKYSGGLAGKPKNFPGVAYSMPGGGVQTIPPLHIGKHKRLITNIDEAAIY